MLNAPNSLLRPTIIIGSICAVSGLCQAGLLHCLKRTRSEGAPGVALGTFVAKEPPNFMEPALGETSSCFVKSNDCAKKICCRSDCVLNCGGKSI